MAPIPREVIEAARSERGGFTKRQLAAWGVPWPPPHGWKRRLETVGPGPVCPQCQGAGVLADDAPSLLGDPPTRAASPHDPLSPCLR